MNGIDSLKNLPVSGLVVLCVLVACQLTVMIWALVRLISDNRERVVGCPRLVWGLVIVFGQLVGPVVFLVLHARERRALAQQLLYQQGQMPLNGTQSKAASTVIDGLYGKRNKPS